MIKKLIEMVCTGNQGRSPVAELLTRMYLTRHGILGEYEAISSGTSVDAIVKGNLSISFMKHVISIAKSRGGIYNQDILPLVEKAVSTDDKTALEAFYSIAAERFVAEERRYRVEILPRFGIVGELKEERYQTIARPNTIAVFSMAEKNNVQVKEIYCGAGYEPLITVLSAYATQDPAAEIPNAFGLPEKAYIAAAETLCDHIPNALDRLLV